MTGRLIVVSNRVTPLTGRNATQAGGLAVGVHAALRDAGGLWFGWSGEVVEQPGATPKRFKAARVDYATLDLSSEEYDAYYLGFANRTLWPLFHYRLDLAVFEHDWYDRYRAVNRRFAQAVAALLEPGDRVWVHDYHLIPFANELRALGANNRIGFFLHIPFPALEIFAALPWHRELARDLCSYDVVGVHTQGDLRHFQSYVERELGGLVLRGGEIRTQGKRISSEAIPIGIDVEEFQKMAVHPEARKNAAKVKAALPNGRKLMIGVDRLDYSKGIPERLHAFEALMRDYPQHRERVTFMQISAPSREDAQEYVDIRAEVEALSGRINGVYGEVDWVPLRYINRSFSRRVLAGFFRLAKIAMVTPLRDGMNLVAKEYVAAQDPGDPGMLALSRFAGAADELDAALIVNPYDSADVAKALDRGLSMSKDERIARHRVLLGRIRDKDVDAWRSRFLQLLDDASPADPLDDDGFDDDKAASRQRFPAPS